MMYLFVNVWDITNYVHIVNRNLLSLGLWYIYAGFALYFSLIKNIIINVKTLKNFQIWRFVIRIVNTVLKSLAFYQLNQLIYIFNQVKISCIIFEEFQLVIHFIISFRSIPNRLILCWTLVGSTYSMIMWTIQDTEQQNRRFRIVLVAVPSLWGMHPLVKIWLLMHAMKIAIIMLKSSIVYINTNIWHLIF